MSGETHLSTLLRTLAPVLSSEIYTFATVTPAQLAQIDQPLGTFRETEGLTVICPLHEAQTLGLTHDGAFHQITLSVHSALSAVGLTARVSTALAEHGIPCNLVAGFHHDHLFVPTHRADDAMHLLAQLQGPPPPQPKLEAGEPGPLNSGAAPLSARSSALPIQPPSWMNALPEPYASLARRLGTERLQQRLIAQASHWAQLAHQGSGIFRLEKHFPLDAFVAQCLILTRLARRTRANHLNPRLVERTWHFPRLPAAFDGFRLLQLTDLHLDLDPDFTAALVTRLQGISCDAVVITGDFRNSTSEDFNPAMADTRRLLATLPSVPRFGILGNHDFIEQVPALEADGLPILLNESAAITRDGQTLWIAGVDDPHFYRTHDLAAATRDIPADAFTVLLAHSPEIADELPPERFDLVLCGHTHGGQLCLPGGRWLHVPLKNQPAARIRGPWTAAGAQGYTSVGTGSCGVPARLNCPGEYTLHTLRAEGVKRKS